MIGVNRVFRKNKASRNNRVKDKGVVVTEGTETISEGVTRLNKAIINDKRTLRTRA